MKKWVVQGNVHKIQKLLYNEKSFWGFQVKEPTMKKLPKLDELDIER